MPRFTVKVHGADLEVARRVLDGAGVPTVASHAHWVPRGEEEQPGVQFLSALPEADNAADAERKVGGALAGAGAYTVGEAQPAPHLDS